jgi:hypothetical protein
VTFITERVARGSRTQFGDGQDISRMDGFNRDLLLATLDVQRAQALLLAFRDIPDPCIRVQDA